MSGLWFLDQVVAEASTTSEEGMAARAEGVTASEIHDIAVGSRATHRRILEAKLNGATWHGNRHTRRGHEREPFLLAHAGELFGGIEPNAALLRHPEHRLHLATPDAFGVSIDHGGIVGVEAKSHEFGYVETRIPAEHVDQMQWGMHVTGCAAWLYVTEVMGEDGSPTLDAPRAVWVLRDDARIARLVAEAERFIVWREAGAPDLDELPADIEDALAVDAEDKAYQKTFGPAVKAARELIRQYAIAAQEEPGAGSKGAGMRAEFVYSVTTATALDEGAWAAAEPDGYAEWLEWSTRVSETAATAALLYHRPVTTARLNTYPSKEMA